jgi:predicted AlkP superfamily phosphohydrolase/phosphomutase
MRAHRDERASRTFVLGLDGVPWGLIERWTDAGELANFSRLREEGAAGPCESTTPATTPVAWPSIATGVRPDKHGIYGFRELSSDYRHSVYTNDHLKQPPLWEFLTPAVVANVPLTYPASEIDGTLVAGPMAPEINDRFTFPSEFRDELLREIEDYQISLPWGRYTDAREEFLERFEDLVSARRSLMRILMNRSEDWRLFFFVYTAPDRLQHLFWDEDLLLDHYRKLDEILGEVMSYVSDCDANLYVISDHGFGPTERLVNVNRLLERKGYLREQNSSATRSLFDGVGLGRQKVQGLLRRAGIDGKTLLSVLPRVLVDKVAEKFPGDHELYDVDFDRTTAFAHGSGAIYVNDTDRFVRGTVRPGEVPRIKEELVILFKGARDPKTGDRILDVADGNDLFPADDDAPDLVVSGASGYQTQNSLADSVVEPAEEAAAGHKSEGILLAWGPSIAAGARPNNATVYDLAPTLLSSVGEPIPETADGRVLTELFCDDAATEPETRAYSRTSGHASAVDEDFEDVEERLKGLGYLN